MSAFPNGRPSDGSPYRQRTYSNPPSIVSSPASTHSRSSRSNYYSIDSNAAGQASPSRRRTLTHRIPVSPVPNPGRNHLGLYTSDPLSTNAYFASPAPSSLTIPASDIDRRYERSQPSPSSPPYVSRDSGSISPSSPYPTYSYAFYDSRNPRWPRPPSLPPKDGATISSTPGPSVPRVYTIYTPHSESATISSPPSVEYHHSALPSVRDPNEQPSVLRIISPSDSPSQRSWYTRHQRSTSAEPTVRRGSTLSHRSHSTRRDPEGLRPPHSRHDSITGRPTPSTAQQAQSTVISAAPLLGEPNLPLVYQEYSAGSPPTGRYAPPSVHDESQGRHGLSKFMHSIFR